ncbi:transcription termination/antitermination protein NusG [Methylocystis sp. MJC1]|nr:hypothetical protein [Methylocystis sp. MJC1]
MEGRAAMAQTARANDVNRKFWEQAEQEPAWYVVEAIEGKEFELSIALEAAFMGSAEVLHLVEVVRTTRRIMAGGVMRRAASVRKVSRFGPLIFLRVAMTKGLCEKIFHMPLAAGVVRCKDGERPVVVSAEMIEFYKKSDSFGTAVMAMQIAVGDTVEVTQGPAIGWKGVVERVDNRRSLILDTSKFGGSAPLFVEAGHVALVVQCRKRPIEPDVKLRQRKRA